MQSFIPSRSFLSAMTGGLLALELRRSPNPLQLMRHLPPSTCISRAHRLVPFVAGNHRRSSPLSLAQPRAEGSRQTRQVGTTYR